MNVSPRKWTRTLALGLALLGGRPAVSLRCEPSFLVLSASAEQERARRMPPEVETYRQTLPAIDLSQNNLFVRERSPSGREKNLNLELRLVERPPTNLGQDSPSEYALRHPRFWEAVQNLKKQGIEVLIDERLEASGYIGVHLGQSKKIVLSPRASWLAFSHEINHGIFEEKVTQVLLRDYRHLIESGGRPLGDRAVNPRDINMHLAFARFMADLFARADRGELTDPYLRQLLRRYEGGVRDMHLLNEVVTSDKTLGDLGQGGFNLFSAEIREERIYRLANLDRGTRHSVFYRADQTYGNGVLDFGCGF